MSSHDRPRINRLLEEVIRLLSEDCLRESCDEPIEEAVGSFQWPESPPLDQAIFLDTLGSFVSHVYAHAWSPKQKLAPGQARAEAVRLLQGHYQGQNASGYEAAYLDARHSTFAGLEFVLGQLGQILVDKARKQRVRWVLHQYLNCLPWALSRQVASELMQRWQIVDAESLHQTNPSQMADHCVDLLMAQIASESQVSEMLSAGTGFHGF